MTVMNLINILSPTSIHPQHVTGQPWLVAKAIPSSEHDILAI
jgi:hypothetical protein